MAGSKRLEGKVAIVTGASSGIGRATACQMAAEGAKVVLAARSEDKLDDLMKDIKSNGGEAAHVGADVSKEADNKTMIDTAMEKYGRLDICFLNAGTGDKASITEISEELFDKIINTNLKSVVMGLKYALPAIEKSGGSGSIVINSSCVSLQAKASETAQGNAVYAASKAGANMIMQYAAIDGAKHKTRVNCLAPGVIHTNIMGDIPADKFQEMCEPAHLLGRYGKAEEMAHVVCFLASDEASFVTGSVLLADGGWSIKA